MHPGEVQRRHAKADGVVGQHEAQVHAGTGQFGLGEGGHAHAVHQHQRDQQRVADHAGDQAVDAGGGEAAPQAGVDHLRGAGPGGGLRGVVRVAGGRRGGGRGVPHRAGGRVRHRGVRRGGHRPGTEIQGGCRLLQTQFGTQCAQRPPGFHAFAPDQGCRVHRAGRVQAGQFAGGQGAVLAALAIGVVPLAHAGVPCGMRGGANRVQPRQPTGRWRSSTSELQVQRSASESYSSQIDLPSRTGLSGILRIASSPQRPLPSNWPKSTEASAA